MKVLSLLRCRVILALLAATFGLFAMSGCSGGWGDLKPTVTTQLAGQSQTVTAGQTATFTVAATGMGPFTYQWYLNGAPVSGATSTSYTTPATTSSANGSVYTVSVTNAGGTVMSTPYNLTVNTPPAITTQPASQTVLVGQAATFTVVATGTAPFSYQWYLGGTAISGATSSSYTTPVATTAGSSAVYTVTVTNMAGTVTSTVGTVSVTALTPTLSFATVASQTFGVAPFPVSATSASSGAVTYAVTSGPATISGSTVTITGAGTVVLGASQAANGNYTTATATTSFTVAAETPTLNFGTVTSQTFGVVPFAVSATSASSGAVTYIVASGPATISGSTVTIIGTGTVVLNASQVANGNYTAATATTSFTVAAETPALSFATVASQTFGVSPFAVSATSASSGAVTYTVTSGPATISGSTVTITGTGTVVLGASQVANGNYTAATATTSFAVGGEVPTLSFATIASQTFGVSPFAVSATSASSGAVTYTVTSGPATISGSTVTITGAGTVVLGASQVANGNYSAATATTSFTVGAETPTLVFATIGAQKLDTGTLTASATSASSGAVTYTVTSGPATILGNIVTLTATGTVVLHASQAANGNYTTATATTSFTVANSTPLASSLTGSSSTPPYNTSVTLTPTFSGGTAVIGSSGSGSSDITTTAVSGSSYPTSMLTSAKTYTLTVTGTGGNTSTTSVTITPTSVMISPIAPANQTMAPGQQAFAATASGGSTNTVTWSASAGTINSSGVWTSPNTASTYTITATSVDKPSVSVSTTAIVSAPVITAQPASVNACTSASATLAVTANYASTYQWSLGGNTITGATSSSYFIASAASTDAGNYTVAVTNPAGSVTSGIATVVVGSSISSQPTSISASATQTATFSVAVTGVSPFTYQWYRVPSGSSTGAAITGAKSSSYTTPALTTSNSGDQYYVTVTDTCSTITSSNATLTVANTNVPPTITTQPVGETVAMGGTTTFTVVASGSGTLMYQWYRIPAGSAQGTFSTVSGATSTTYTVPSSMTAASNDQDAYYVTVTNAYGSATSQHATLAVGAGVMIQITDQPVSAYVNSGDPATFTVVATSTLPLTYQWYEAAPGSSTFALISGATNATYTIPSVTSSQTNSVFYVVVSNGSTAAVTSSSTSLFVGVPPSIASCSSSWNIIGSTTAFNAGTCSFQLTAATTDEHGEIVWPSLISTGNIQLSFTITTSDPSSPPADGFAMVLGDPSLGAKLTSLGATGLGLGAEGIPGFVLAFDDYYNSGIDPSTSGDPAYLGVGRGETALWENPYSNVNNSLPGGANAIAEVGHTIPHSYVVTIVQGQMTVTMDGTQVFSGNVSVPPVAYLYFTSSTGGYDEQTVISNIQATVSAPSN